MSTLGMLISGEPGSLVGVLSARRKERNVSPGSPKSQSIAACERCRCFRRTNCADTVTAWASFVVFVGGAVVSLATSRDLVTRLERVGERLGFSEASLGMVAALAADTPEITASITAIAHHQQTVGAGVVLGSNVFNLVALLGLGAVVAGGIDLHRRVVVLGGSVAMIVGVACLLSVGGLFRQGQG